MSGLDVRRLASLLVVALFVLPLLAPLIAAVPVSAQVTPLRVTNFVITAGGELGFILNRTVLIAGHPVQGAPVLYFWASKNPDTTLVNPGVEEFLLATLAVGTTPGVIFGTLIVNETIGGWLGVGTSDRVYLKVTSSRATGAIAVVSDNFTLIVDPTIIERVLKVQNAPSPETPTEHLANRTYTAPFRITNYPEFVLNLSAIGKGFGKGMTLVDDAHSVRFDAINFTLTKGTQVLYASNGTTAKAQIVRPTYFLKSPKGFGKQAVDTGRNVVRLNGTLGVFALLSPTDLISINGTSVGHQAFSLIATVFNGSARVQAPFAKVVRGDVRVVTTSEASDIFNYTVVSIGWTKPVRIYPTVSFSFTDIGPDGDNPGSRRYIQPHCS